MSGSRDAWILEIRKFAVMEVDSPNFESVTIEKLRALDKPIKLQKYNYCIQGGAMSRIELSFTNGLDSATYQSTAHKQSYTTNIEQTWDISRQIKKVSVAVNYQQCRGLKFLDEKDNEIAKWDCDSTAPWTEPKEIPDGFEIIGVYGNTNKGWDIEFGFLLWNPHS